MTVSVLIKANLAHLHDSTENIVSDKPVLPRDHSTMLAKTLFSTYSRTHAALIFTYHT